MRVDMNLDAWLAVLAGASPTTSALRALLRRTGSAQALLSLSHGELVQAGVAAPLISRLRAPDEALMASWRAWLQASPNRHLITLEDPLFPSLLTELADGPPALWIEGDQPARLADPQIAIVGSRSPTPAGREIANEFAAAFSHAGLTVTSGLASGIDTAGHLGALRGTGGTIAVLGSGLARVFPRANLRLARDIARGGLLVSEYPPDTAPRRHHFPQRNRIIAGLALATVVVEAGRHSGALITARIALDAGREVYAVPGSIHNPVARGCHALIRQGATLIEHSSDVLGDLSEQLQRDIIAPSQPLSDAAATPSQPSLFDDDSYLELLNSLDFSPAPIADLTRRSGLTAAELSSMLLLLEMEGYVEALPGGRYVRTAKRCR